MRKFILFVENIDRILRLVIALVVALVVMLVIRLRHLPATTFMFTWIAFAGTTLLFSWITILTIHPKDTALVASEQDSSRLLTFLFVVIAACISLFAIILLLQETPNGVKGSSYHLLLSGGSVACSWVLIHTLFTLRYAHLYYLFRTKGAKDQFARGLEFPGEEHPDFLDFAYFSFVLGMTFQVSDVQISSRRIRRLSLLHGFISFVYNTIIIALSINIISGLIAR